MWKLHTKWEPICSLPKKISCISNDIQTHGRIDTPKCPRCEPFYFCLHFCKASATESPLQPLLCSICRLKATTSNMTLYRVRNRQRDFARLGRSYSKTLFRKYGHLLETRFETSRWTGFIPLFNGILGAKIQSFQTVFCNRIIPPSCINKFSNLTYSVRLSLKSCLFQCHWKHQHWHRHGSLQLIRYLRL